MYWLLYSVRNYYIRLNEDSRNRFAYLAKSKKGDRLDVNNDGKGERCVLSSAARSGVAETKRAYARTAIVCRDSNVLVHVLHL